MKIFEHRDSFYLTTESGEEYKIEIEFDYQPPEKGNLEYPGSEAEFSITNARVADSGILVDLDSIANLKDFESEMSALPFKEK
jgi:hypothetical protein